MAVIDRVGAEAAQRGREQGAVVQAGLRNAFAASITRIFLFVIGLIAVALVVALALAELPLRTNNTDEPTDGSATAGGAAH